MRGRIWPAKPTAKNTPVRSPQREYTRTGRKREITYKEDMPLDQQWKRIIKEAHSSLTQALESLPSDDIFKYVDLIGDISPKS